MHKKTFKAYFNVFFLVAVFSLTIWAVFRGEDLQQLWDSLKMANAFYLIPCILCVVLFILGESLVIKHLLHTLGTRISFFHCCLYSFIGFFYSCITPSASGGQPMQVIAMRKDKIPVAVSAVVLAIVTITYKLVLVLMGLAVVLFRPESIMARLEPVENLVWIGLGLNLVFILGLILLVFHPNAVRRCAAGIIALMHRIRPFRNHEKIMEKLDLLANQYSGTAQFYRTHPGVIINVFIITALQRILLFFVAWLTYRAFSLSGDDMVTIVMLQAMIAVAADMLPLPGGMGISENLFLSIFLPIFGAALVLPGMMLCRGISYYAQLLISGAMTAVASFVIREKK